MKAPRLVTLSGTLAGSEEAEVAAGAAGKVIATYVERGSVVKKGAVLARLDSRAASAQAAQAAADAEGSKIAGAAGEARLRSHRADVPEGGDLEGRLRPRPHAVREQQVDGLFGGGAQDADRRGAARHRDPRAVFGHGRRARGQRRANTCCPRRASRRWSTPIRCASRSRCPRPTFRWSSRGCWSTSGPREGRRRTRSITARSATSGRRCAARAATRSSRRCSPTRRTSCARGCS